MIRPLRTIAAVLAVCVLAYYGWWFISRARPETPEAAARAALGEAKPKDRESAAVRLSQLGKPAIPHLVQVLGESPQPEVRAACIRGLADQWSYRNMPLMLDALEDESPVVRAQAGHAVAHLMRINNELRWNESAERRAEAVKALRSEWERFRNMKLGAAFIRQQEGEEP